MNLDFIKQTINWDKTRLNLINETLDKYENKEIHIFKNRKGLNKWYKQKFGKNMYIMEKEIKI